VVCYRCLGGMYCNNITRKYKNLWKQSLVPSSGRNSAPNGDDRAVMWSAFYRCRSVSARTHAPFVMIMEMLMIMWVPNVYRNILFYFCVHDRFLHGGQTPKKNLCDASRRSPETARLSVQCAEVFLFRDKATWTRRLRRLVAEIVGLQLPYHVIQSTRYTFTIRQYTVLPFYLSYIFRHSRPSSAIRLIATKRSSKTLRI
jgi:hypothetical protein